MFVTRKLSVALTITAVVLLSLTAGAPAVLADTLMFTLSTGNTGALATVPGPYATVTLTLVGNQIHVTVAGISPYQIFGMGGAFGFNVANGDTAGLGITGLPAGWSFCTSCASNNFDGFGNFTVEIDGPQASASVASFSFTVSRTNGFTSAGALVSGTFPFAAHLIGNGVTGFASTPEPGTLALFGTGLIILGGALRRRLKA